MKKIGEILVMALGITAIILFFLRAPLWAGVAFITMGMLGTCFKLKGGEFCVIIGFIPILLHFQQIKCLMVLNFIILIISLYNMVVLVQISQNLTAEDKKERRQEFNEQFRQIELVHVLFMKFLKCVGLMKSRKF